MVSFGVLSRFLLLLAATIATITAEAQQQWCQGDDDCYNGGQCILMQGDDNPHYCQCPAGFGGHDCSSPCDFECENGGSCRIRHVGLAAHYYCECPPHQFMGPKCNIPFVQCPGKLDVKCFHGGTCERTTQGYQCICPSDRTGAFCQLEAAAPNTPGIGSTSSSSNQDNDPNRQQSSSSSTGNNNEDKTVRTAVILFVNVVVGAAMATGLAMYFCRSNHHHQIHTFDTNNEADITSEGVVAATNTEIC